MSRTAAVFFDVDFTLIRPGPRFDGSGYETTCRAHGIPVDPARFDDAVVGAAALLDLHDLRYHPRVYIDFTRRVIEGMGGTGDGVDAAAREIYRDWAEHRHFELYDDTLASLRAIHAAGLRIGLISNSHRPLDSFQTHFGLDGLIDVTISSSDHGYLKPHPGIFYAALERMGVRPAESAMVGDSLTQDVAGARAAGMRAILIARARLPERVDPDVEVIRSLAELVPLVVGSPTVAAE